MASISTRINRIGVLLMMSAAMHTAGCTSPPSVSPLLRVTERALIAESARLDKDAERDGAHTRQSLNALEDAYHRDLEHPEVLTPEWVREATSVYVTAREVVLRHEAALKNEHRVRAENLRAAALATRRAIVLIEHQDSLLRGIAGEDLGRLLDGFEALRKEPGQ